MMNRLLILITRMYASNDGSRDGGADEFLEVWAGDKSQSHKMFHCGKKNSENYVLVIHGYDYPLHIGRAIERAQLTVGNALQASGLDLKLGSLKIGFAFHPRPNWAPERQKIIAAEIQAYLQDKGATVDFVESYRRESILWNTLAPACLGQQEFTDELDRVWKFFHKESALYDQRFGFLYHDLIHSLQPLEDDLEGWKLSGFNPTYGQEILKEHRAKTLAAFDNARHIVVGASSENSSIKSLAIEISNSSNELHKRDALMNTLGRIESLFEDDSRYLKAKQLLHIFAEPEKDEICLKRLQKELECGNSYSDWFKALLAELRLLRNEWTE